MTIKLDPAQKLPPEIFFHVLSFVENPSVFRVSTLWKESALKCAKTQLAKLLSEPSFKEDPQLTQDCLFLQNLTEGSIAILSKTDTKDLPQAFQRFLDSCQKVVRRVLRKAFKQENERFSVSDFREGLKEVARLQRAIPFYGEQESALQQADFKRLESVIDTFSQRDPSEQHQVNNAYPYALTAVLETEPSDLLSKILEEDYPFIRMENGPCECCFFRPYMNALITAAERGNEKMVRVLFENPRFVQQAAHTALQEAAKSNQLAVFNFILSWNFPSQREQIGIEEALYFSAKEGHEEIVKAVFAQTRWTVSYDRWEKAFLTACSNGYLSLVEILLEEGRKRKWIYDSYGSYPVNIEEETFKTLKMKSMCWYSLCPKRVIFEGLCSAVLGNHLEVFEKVLDLNKLSQNQVQALINYLKKEKKTDFLKKIRKQEVLLRFFARLEVK